MFFDLFKQRKQDTTEKIINYTRINKDRVHPAFCHLGKDFYFKPNVSINVNLSYLEFLDYLFHNYQEFINKDFVNLYLSNAISLDDEKLNSFKALYTDYKRKPRFFKTASEVVYRMKVEFESSQEFSTLYDGPSEVEMVIKSGHEVLDESGESIVLVETVPDYNEKFLSKYGDLYEFILEKNPIEFYEKYACLCWALSQGYDIDYLLKFKFVDNQVLGWSACLRLVNQDLSFTELFKINPLDSFVANKFVSLYDCYGINPVKFIKYGDCASYEIIEQVLFNGYDTSVLNPSVVSSEFTYMIPICLEIGVPFLDLFYRFGRFTIYASCCVKLGISLSNLEGKTFTVQDWEFLVEKSYELVYSEQLSYMDVLGVLQARNPSGYDRLVSSPMNDLFFDDLKKLF